MVVNNVTWADIKVLIDTNKHLRLQFIENPVQYEIWVKELSDEYRVEILKEGEQPASDEEDFVDNYKDGANLPRYYSKNPHPGGYVSKYLKNAGSKDMNIDGTTPVEFKIEPTAGKKMFIHRILITIKNDSITHTKFGGITGGLANGIEVKVVEDGTERFVHEDPIKLNSEFWEIAYDANIISSEKDILVVRWTFSKAGTPLHLHSSDSDKFFVMINDDLTELDGFCILAQGYEVDE